MLLIKFAYDAGERDVDVGRREGLRRRLSGIQPTARVKRAGAARRAGAGWAGDPRASGVFGLSFLPFPPSPSFPKRTTGWRHFSAWIETFQYLATTSPGDLGQPGDSRL